MTHVPHYTAFAEHDDCVEPMGPKHKPENSLHHNMMRKVHLWFSQAQSRLVRGLHAAASMCLHCRQSILPLRPGCC